MNNDLKSKQMNEWIKLKETGAISREEANRRFAEIQNPVVSKYADKFRVLDIIKQCAYPSLQNAKPYVDQMLSGEINVTFGLSKEDGYGLLVEFGDDKVVAEIAVPTDKKESDFLNLELLQSKHKEYMSELMQQKVNSEKKPAGSIAASVINKNQTKIEEPTKTTNTQQKAFKR